uniref:Protein Vpu n=1 Tax=Human immunodeficiency virus type 1 TaxID=11676 RepID=A0A0C5K7G2_HV1|nr:vpu protein [Human immunodeficiency virus 1]
MNPLEIAAIVGLVVAFLAAIVVWTIVFIEYRKIRRQKRIDKLIDRIRDRAEDSGNESEGDEAGIVKIGVEMGPHDLWNVDDL